MLTSLLVTLILPSLVGAMHTTVVALADSELQQVLQILFVELNGSQYVTVALLKSLGLFSDSIIAYLHYLGYIIV